MAKKKRSKKARRRRKERKVTARAAQPRAETPSVQVKPVAQPRAAPKPMAKTRKYQVDFRKEYPYIYSDLERVGIIAALMLAFMLALSFILK